MMLLVYNLLQLLLAPLALLVLPVYLISRPEKCKTILPKLGCTLDPVAETSGSVIWVHALSVGEVTSVLPLVRHLKQERGDAATVVFSASTVSGYNLAVRLLTPHCDRLIYAPLDILPVVRYFVRKISPDLFILVETDFWPNLLHTLKRSNAGLLLVNGRVSESSMRGYLRFRPFFHLALNQFDTLCMQTSEDRDRMIRLGIDEKKIAVLGNLKFTDAPQPRQSPDSSPFPENHLVILAGSTHDGEERMLLDSYRLLRNGPDTIHLAIAPRNTARTDSLVSLIESYGFVSRRYSAPSDHAADVTVIDTIGDLSDLYRFGDICFIGGSLVDKGGHNPIEAARYGRVVIFGPSMSDFSEISTSLINAGGAIQVHSPTDLHEAIAMLIASEHDRTERGQNGHSFVMRNRHIITDHMRIIRPYL